MDREEYEKYLLGEHWQRVRRKTLEWTEGRCIRCGALADDCHHTTYRSLGHEARGDVIPVCSDCHKFLSGRSSYDPTAEEPTFPQETPQPDCQQCRMPAEIEVEGQPWCRSCYAQVAAPDE